MDLDSSDLPSLPSGREDSIVSGIPSCIVTRRLRRLVFAGGQKKIVSLERTLRRLPAAHALPANFDFPGQLAARRGEKEEKAKKNVFFFFFLLIKKKAL